MNFSFKLCIYYIRFSFSLDIAKIWIRNINYKLNYFIIKLINCLIELLIILSSNLKFLNYYDNNNL